MGDDHIDGGADDPHRRWRRPAPGGPPPRATGGADPEPNATASEVTVWELDVDRPPAPEHGKAARSRWAWFAPLVAVVVTAATMIVWLAGRDDDTATTTVPAPASATTPPAGSSPQPTGVISTVPPTAGGRRTSADTPDPRVLLDPGADTHLSAVSAAYVGGTDRGAGLFFAGDGATVREGPWLHIEPQVQRSFVGPASTVDSPFGGAAIAVGRGPEGAELAVTRGSTRSAVSVSAVGLPAGTAVDVAAAIAPLQNATWVVPAAALPGGLRDATATLSPAARRSLDTVTRYETDDGTEVTISGTVAAPGNAPASATFELEDLTYLSINGDEAIAGSRREVSRTISSLRWHHAGVDIELSSSDLGIADLVPLAEHVRTPDDSDWDDAAWDAANDTTPTLPPPTDVVLGSFTDDDGHDVQVLAGRRSGTITWRIEGSGLGASRTGIPASDLVVDVAATPHAGAVDTASYVAVVVLGDESLDGATLQAVIGAAAGDGANAHTTVSATVTALDGEAAEGLGYSHGTVMLMPWGTGTFTVDLVPPDGTAAITRLTPADLWP